MKVCGIDLSGKEENPSGVAILTGRKFNTELVFTDGEIIELCVRERPKVVTVDAPLSLPVHGSLRLADRLLIKRGFRVFPPLFGSMRSLTQRGIRLAKELRKQKFEVIEIHPRTSGLALFGKPDRLAWIKGLRERGWKIETDLSAHEIDAALAALTGALYLQKKTEAVGGKAEGTIIIPIQQVWHILSTTPITRKISISSGKAD